ncbi:ABC transporter ATP-binding protein [Bordetella holmesii]|nr:ABC transporter ATP-binding protein [Bordetella holmesii]AHV94244.1 ABC transporter family protein [Bordetella holmesii ATCC 51541]AIT28430.1 ABC transporter family protein [Bordetella holmesii 44057]EWM41223.1 ABC transporter family protein [Bordetella holmesii 35009]AMD47094.1 ABC transporter ATP-binding protein [Bordetella holmesii H558]AMD47531.1 amino acid ABC transporter ATPase [Bordetella holmesii F627]
MLAIEDMAISYGPMRALRGVSMHIGQGEIVALLGANGAGKSSLLRGIMGLMPAAGALRFEGRDLCGLSTPERVMAGLAMAPEGRQVFTDQTVHENLLLGGYLIRHDRPRLARQIEGYFEMFPRLRERREQVAGTLSGGEQQMLAIARALMSNPCLLILDEPSLGLAPLVTADIFRGLKRLRDAGMTILLVEQMANQALAIADPAYVLEGGTMTLQGLAADLRRDPRIREAYLGGEFAPEAVH